MEIYNKSNGRRETITWNSRDLLTFFAIISMLREKEDKTINISFNYLKELIGEERKGYDRIKQHLKQLYNKKLGLIHHMEKDEKGNYYGFPIFTDFVIDMETKTLRVKVHERALPLLNNIKDNFTRFYLSDITELRGKYSILLFKELKQYRLSGVWVVSYDRFKELFDIRDMSTQKVRERVINPAIRELNGLFDNLECERIYKNTEKGKVIDKLKFTFTPEDPVQFADSDTETRFADYNLAEGNIDEKRWGELGEVYSPKN